MISKFFAKNFTWQFSLIRAKILSRFYYRFLLLKLGRKSILIKPQIVTFRNISIGSNVMIWPNSRIEGIIKYGFQKFNPIIEIGDDVGIEQNLHLTCAKSVIIGSGSAIAANVTITDINHLYTDINIAPEKQPIEVKEVVIGKNCKIYNNSVILPGAKLGNHNIVGANSVVVSGIYEDNIVLVGSPAKMVKKFDFKTKAWRKINSKGEFIDI